MREKGYVEANQRGRESLYEISEPLMRICVEVKDNRVTILSDVAELASQIDVERARRAREDAERALMNGDDVECEASLRRAHVRLLVAGA